MALDGWKPLLKACSRRRREPYPIPAYSEFMPAPRVGWRPYDPAPPEPCTPCDPFAWQVSEREEIFELQPGLQLIARQVLNALMHAMIC